MKLDHFQSSSKKQAKLFSTGDDLIKLLNEFDTHPYKDKLINKKGIIGHSGGSEGIRSYIQSVPAKGYSFVFLAKYDQIPFADIVKTVTKIIEGEPYEIPVELNRKPISLTEDKLIKYVGKYDFKELGHIILDIRIEKGQLVAYQEEEFSGILYPESDHVFFGDYKSKESIKFLLDDGGHYKAVMDFKGAAWMGLGW